MPGRSLAFCAEAPERPNPSARVTAMTVVFIFGLPSLLLITNKHLSVRRPRCSQPIGSPRHDVAKTKGLPEVPAIAHCWQPPGSRIAAGRISSDPIV